MMFAPGPVVLFLGDSITHAHRRPDEIHDCYQLGCGYVNGVAAELSSESPRTQFRFVNRGECGATVKSMLDRWPQDCPTLDATLVSILIGINDTNAPDYDSSAFRRDYQRLLDGVRERWPAIKLMLLEPFGVAAEPFAEIEIIALRQLDRLPTIQSVVRDLAAANDALFVPLQHLFDVMPSRTWTLDGIHPSAAGHWKIARAWTAAARRAGWFPSLQVEGEKQ